MYQIRKMRKSVIVFLLFLFVFQAGVSAQNKVSLSGVVKDGDGNPLSPVMVAVDQSTTGTYTDVKGRYSLSLTPGKYTLVVSSFGYNTQHKEIDLKSNQVMDFVLEENSVSLEAVDVYGKTKAQQAREGVFAVNALQISSALQNTSANLSNIIGRTTSVRIREEGGTGSDFDLSINGLSGNSVRYFIDGVPLASLGSGVTLANIPTNIIEQVEIYKGVVPAHLGADALGGAINIITKNNQRNYLDVSYGIGSFHTHKADLNAQFVEAKTGLIIRPTASMNYAKNDYTMKGVLVWDEESRKYIPVNRKRFHDDYFSVLGQVEVGFVNKPWADAFFVGASYSEVKKEIQTGSVQSKVYGMAEREDDAWAISARYQKRNLFVKNLHLNLNLSHTWDHSLAIDTAYRKYDWNGDYIVSSNMNEIRGRARSMRHTKRPTTIARANIDYRLNDSHSFNMNYLLNRMGNKLYDDVQADFESTNDVISKHILSLSYNQSFLNERMENTFFLKEYINHTDIGQTELPTITGSANMKGSYTDNFFGYGIGSRLTIVDELAVKASYEHSTRLPLAREMLGNGTTIYANVALKPENSDNVNLGLFGTWLPAPGHIFYYEVTGFLRYTDNYIRSKMTEKEGMLQYENVAGVHIKGVEGEMRYDWRNKLQLSTNVSFQDARNQEKYKSDGKPSALYNYRVPNQPWLFGNVEASYTWHNVGLPQSRLRLGATYQWVHWYFLDWAAFGDPDTKSRIPGQHVYNTDLTYSWKDGRYNVALECANLFDETVYDNYKLQKPGRSFFVKFRLFIN